MPILRDEVIPFAATVRGPVADGEIAALADHGRLKIVHAPADEASETWEALNARLFSTRGDVTLAIDGLFPRGADLSFLRHVPNVRRLCVTSSGAEQISSLESIAGLPNLEALQIGSPSLKSFDVLDTLPPDRLRELRLADTLPNRPSLRPVARFTGLRTLQIEGHSADLDAIRSVRALQQLSLQSVRLNDFGLLRALPALASFRFALGGVKDVGVLAELRRLRHLNVFQSKGFDSLAFLAEMRGLEMLELKNLPQVTEFPDLSRLGKLRRVSLDNLKRLERLDGLAKAPALERYMHLVVSPKWKPERFLRLLDHPTLRYFTAVVGSRKRDGEIRELAARKGKLSANVTPEKPVVFEI